MERNLKGLLKLAVIVKKADPPHRGLNSDNPLLREIYRSIGYVPQAPGTYLHSDKQDADLKKARKIYNNWMSLPENLGADFSNPSSPHVIAADWDYKRATGKSMPYYIPKNNGHAIILGSYPFSTKEILLHELGHAKDEKLRSILKFWRDLKKDYQNNTLDFERRAWNLSGIPKSNKIRKLALKTYELSDEYSKKRTVNGKYPGGSFSADNAIHEYVLPKLYPILAENYVHPEVLTKKIDTKGIPVIHDYKSALRAANNGIKFHAVGL